MKYSLAIFLFCFIFLSLFLFPSYAIAQKEKSIELSDTKVIYDLPHPGILPDHPLFFLKQIRAKFTEVLIREPMKKAEYLLVQSDKNVSIAIALAKKGKTKQALSFLMNAEQEYSRLLMFFRASKLQGVGPYEGFVYKLQLSNLKHRETIDTFVKEFPRGQEPLLLKAINMNGQNKDEVEHLN